jgi:hypothetical protein
MSSAVRSTQPIFDIVEEFSEREAVRLAHAALDERASVGVHRRGIHGFVRRPTSLLSAR